MFRVNDIRMTLIMGKYFKFIICKIVSESQLQRFRIKTKVNDNRCFFSLNHALKTSYLNLCMSQNQQESTYKKIKGREYVLLKTKNVKPLFKPHIMSHNHPKPGYKKISLKDAKGEKSSHEKRCNTNSLYLFLSLAKIVPEIPNFLANGSLLAIIQRL